MKDYNLKPTVEDMITIIQAVQEDLTQWDLEETDITFATDFIQDPVTGSIEWTFQTGDNSYTGSCYSYAHWAIGTIDKETSPKELALDIVDQLEELALYDELMATC